MLDEPLLADVTLLILANKQDLPKAITSDKLTELLKLRECKHKWKVQGGSMLAFFHDHFAFPYCTLPLLQGAAPQRETDCSLD